MKSRRALLQAGAMGMGGLALAGVPLRPAFAGPATAGLRAMYSKHREFGTQQADEPTVSSPAPDSAVRALRRLTFGYRPQDLLDFQALGTNFDQDLEAWVDAQLNGYQPGYPPLGDPPLSEVLDHPETNFETLDDSLDTLWQERVVAAPDWPYSQYPLIETQYLALIRAVYSRWLAPARCYRQV